MGLLNRIYEVLNKKSEDVSYFKPSVSPLFCPSPPSHLKVQKQSLRGVKKLFWKIPQKAQEISIIGVSILLKLQAWGLQLYQKKRFQRRGFVVNFGKILRTPFFTEHLRWLFLKVIWLTIFYTYQYNLTHCISLNYLNLNSYILQFTKKILHTPRQVLKYFFASSESRLNLFSTREKTPNSSFFIRKEENNTFFQN